MKRKIIVAIFGIFFYSCVSTQNGTHSIGEPVNIVTKNNVTIYQVLNGRCNVFIIADEKNCILIDTSVKRDKKELFAKIDAFIENGYSFRALILTHSHYDHAMNARDINIKYGMEIIIHDKEKKYINRGKNPPVVGTVTGSKIFTFFFINPALSLKKYKPVTSCNVVDDDIYCLKSLGINAYLLYTPGHSIGSISIIVDDEIAIVGDAMVGYTKSIFPPFATDTKLLIASWEKLINTNCSKFIPSHGTSNNRDVVIKQFDYYKNMSD